MKFACAHCGKTADRPAGHVNRSRAQGLKLYCGRRCFGLDRRKHKTKAQKIEEKRLYDAEYRSKNLAMIKAKKAAHFRATYDPKKARIDRKKKMPRHVEYCRRPEYKRWKREYDRQLRAKEYGPFAEAYQLALELNREIKARSNNYEIRQANQTGNKAQKRAREGGQQKRERNRHRDPAAHG
jgi:hypothetical protein